METQVLVSKSGKTRGLLIVDASCNQALEGGNETDCVITTLSDAKPTKHILMLARRRQEIMFNNKLSWNQGMQVGSIYG
jgi:hypothetical protein